MRRVELNKIAKPALEGLLLSNKEDLVLWAEKKFDPSLLSLLNRKIDQESRMIRVCLVLGKDISTELVKLIPDIRHILIHSSYETPLEDIEPLNCLKSLVSLRLSGDYTKKNLSFEPIAHLMSLEDLEFEVGLARQHQYDFLNQQEGINRLRVNKIDLALVTRKNDLTDLRINRVLKNENLLAERFPNVRSLHLHGCSRIQNHDFLNDLNRLESITINYNSHLKSFPKLRNPELVKSIEMYTCPSFSSIESLLPFTNLERLVLTSYDKPLQVPIKEFRKLKGLSKLKVVYTVWGRRPAKDLEAISEVYKETNWENTAIEGRGIP